ncbi:hypothetical protein pb186bvf_017263 [Paramecium bursaria]
MIIRRILIFLQIRSYLMQYTIYPTINQTFIYPLKELFENGYNYSISDGDWILQSPLLQINQTVIPNTKNINIGFINGNTNQPMNIVGSMNQTYGAIYQLDQQGFLIQTALYETPKDLICNNILVLSENTYIASCYTTNGTLVLIYQNTTNSYTYYTSIKIQYTSIQSTQMVQCKESILLSYLYTTNTFRKLIQYFGKLILRFSILVHKAIHFTIDHKYDIIFIEVFQLTSEYLLINYYIMKKFQYPPIDMYVMVTLGQDYIIGILLDLNNFIVCNYRNQKLKCFPKIQTKDNYTNIYVTQNYISLTNQTSIMIFEMNEFKFNKYYYQQIQNNISLQSISPYDMLIGIFNNQLNIYQIVEAAIVNLNPQSQGQLNIQFNNIQTNQLINQTIFYQPILWNDSNIYVVNQSAEYRNAVDTKYDIQNLANYVIGPNISFGLEYFSSNIALGGDFSYQTVGKNSDMSTVYQLSYSEQLQFWVEIYCYEEYLYINLMKESMEYKFQSIENLIYYQLGYTPIQLVFQQKDINEFLIVITSKTSVFFYQYTIGQQIEQIKTDDLSLFFSWTKQQIYQIDLVYSTLYILTEQPEILIAFQIEGQTISNPILVPVSTQFDLYYMQSNPVSYGDWLFLSNIGSLVIIQSCYNGSFNILFDMDFPYGYQQALLGPLQGGLFVSMSDNSDGNQTAMYFLQQNYLKQVYLGYSTFWQVNTLGTQQSIADQYTYSNKYFYIIQNLNSINYVNQYRVSPHQQNQFFISFETGSGNVYKATPYQNKYFDIVTDIYSTDCYFISFEHGQYMQLYPLLNLTTNNTVEVIYNLSNNYVTQGILFQQFVSFNQSYFNITYNLILGNQTILNNSGGLSIPVRQYFNGAIEQFNVSCQNCSNLTYVQPMESLLGLQIGGSQMSVQSSEYLFILTNESVIMVQMNQNVSTNPQTILYNIVKPFECWYLFIEVISLQPAWICQNITEEIFIFQYDIQTGIVQNLTINTIDEINFISYQNGFIQLIEDLYYWLFYYTYENQTQNIYTIINDYTIITLPNAKSIPFLITEGFNIVGLIIQINSYQNSVLSAILQFENNQFTLKNIEYNQIADEYLSEYSQPKQYGNQISQRRENEFNYAIILLTNQLNPAVFELIFYKGLYVASLNKCYLNQVNFTTDIFNYYGVAGNDEIAVTYAYINSETNSTISLNLFDISVCQQSQTIQPIGFISFQNQTKNFAAFNLIQYDLLMMGLEDFLFLIPVQNTLDIRYQLNNSNIILEIQAINPLFTSIQSFSINQIQDNDVTQDSSIWIWLIPLLGLIILLAAAIKKTCRRTVGRQRRAYQRKRDRNKKLIMSLSNLKFFCIEQSILSTQSILHHIISQQ